MDSFFAFGLFEVAKRSGYFPPELVDTFEPVIQEEARHILLFANWLAWQRHRLPILRRVWFEFRVAAVWAFLVWELTGIARGINSDDRSSVDNNFTSTGSKSVSEMDLSLAALLAICLQENDRRFSGYDPRLRRPATMPAIARLFCWFARLRRAQQVAVLVHGTALHQCVRPHQAERFLQARRTIDDDQVRL